jgi:protein-tyrosine phosphatase
MEDIFWIHGNPFVQLATVLCPRGDELLEDELFGLKSRGIDTLVSHLEPHEAGWLGLAEEGPLAEQVGMEFISYPIPDTHVPPDVAAFREFVEELAGRIRAGRAIGVHCRGSIGRATVTAACTLIHLGWKPRTALVAIETARGCVVPDTAEQEEWIRNYKAQP